VEAPGALSKQERAKRLRKTECFIAESQRRQQDRASGRLRSAVLAEGRLGGGCRCSRSLVNRRSSHPCVKACYQSTSDRTVARGGHDRLLTPAGREGMKRPICAHLVCAIRIGDHQPANSRISNSPSAMKLHASSILLELLVVAPLIVSMTGLVEPDRARRYHGRARQLFDPASKH
jgi:hypothetical protein